MENPSEDINKKYPKLDLQKFITGTDDFLKFAKRWLYKIDKENELYDILPSHLKDYYTIKT